MNLNSNQNDGNPSNFDEMPMGKELLLAMYNTPSKELSTEQIAEIITSKVSTEDNPVVVDKTMVSTIYKTLGESLGQELDLRKRLRVAPKPKSDKPVRVTKAQVLDNIFGQLGLVEQEDNDTANEAEEIIANLNVAEEPEGEYTPSYNGVLASY